MIHVNQTVLKRTYFESGVNKVDLHIFSDTSLEAMCMVAYLRKQDNGEVTFVIGNCRVAPIRNSGQAGDAGSSLWSKTA